MMTLAIVIAPHLAPSAHQETEGPPYPPPGLNFVFRLFNFITLTRRKKQPQGRAGECRSKPGAQHRIDLSILTT